MHLLCISYSPQSQEIDFDFTDEEILAQGVYITGPKLHSQSALEEKKVQTQF